MEALALIVIVVLAIWLIWKLGLFNPVVNLSEAASIASDDFVSKVAHKSVEKASQYEINDDVFAKAMKAKAKNKAYRDAMVTGNFGSQNDE